MNVINRPRRRRGAPVSEQVQMFPSLMKRNASSDALAKGRRDEIKTFEAALLKCAGVTSDQETRASFRLLAARISHFCPH